MIRKLLIAGVLMLAACGTNNNDSPQAVQATLPDSAQNAPVYTETATITPSVTPTLTDTPSVTPSPTATKTPTPTKTFTPSPTATLSPTPTTALLTLTALQPDREQATFMHPTAELTTPEGWSCGDFPCGDDIAGMMERIRVPGGYELSHVGQFPGQPMQITYGQDGRLYATLITDAERNGAVYVLNDDGIAEQYSDEMLVSPIGLAFQPGTDVLYVSSRVTLTQGGALWRVLADGSTELVLDTLPCCYQIIENQPNGITFGPDGYLYLGVGSLTDHGEPQDPAHQRIADFHPLEAAILKIQPHTGQIEVFAQGLRNPYDITFTSAGQFYATDDGTVEGIGNRLLAINAGGHYGFPFWRGKGCEECPLTDASITITPDVVRFAPYALPRGLVAYTGTQFPPNMFDSLFVTLWNGTPDGQRVVRIDPRTVPTDPDALAVYQPEPFVTGLIRPVDVVMAPDGALVVADFIYGHVWKITFTGELNARPAATVTRRPSATPVITESASDTPQVMETGESTERPAPLFVTSTPRP